MVSLVCLGVVVLYSSNHTITGLLVLSIRYQNNTPGKDIITFGTFGAKTYGAVQ